MKIKESTNDFIKRKNKEFEEDKLIITRDIGRKGRKFWKREAWTFMPQSNLRYAKVFIIERLNKTKKEGRQAYSKTWKKGQIEYRIGYFIIGKAGWANGKWVWGQFCPLIPEKDLMKLINKAKREKTIK